MMKAFNVFSVIVISFFWQGDFVKGEENLLKEISLDAGRGSQQVSIPKEYGKFVSVVESGGVHYLYFQDEEGTIRIVLLGIKGIASRSKVDLEALPHSVYKILRGKSKE